MAEPGREAVLTLSLWQHDGIPVARLRSSLATAEQRGGYVVTGRRAILDAVSAWLTVACGDLHDTDTPRRRDGP